MTSVLIFYILGFFVASNIINTWYNTTIAEKILGLFINMNSKYASYSDFMDKIAEKNEFISELLSCQICFSHWISLIIGVIFYLIFDLPIIFAFVAMFSWPSLIYKFYFK